MGKPSSSPGRASVGEAVDELVVRGVAGRGGVAHHEPQVDVGGEGDQVGGQAAERGGGDERPGAAVVDDVRRLVGGQVRVDHGVVEAGALEPERHLVRAVVVRQQDGHVVPGAQPVGVERLGQPARARLELGEGDHGARRRDHGRPVGVRRHVGGRAVLGQGDGGRGSLPTLLVHAAVAVARPGRPWAEPWIEPWAVRGVGTTAGAADESVPASNRWRSVSCGAVESRRSLWR